MTSQEYYTDIKNLFARLESHKSLSELESYIEEQGLTDTIDSFYKKYPKHQISISQTDILELKGKGILTNDNKLDTTVFQGTTLEKLLVAALWKNGDLNKIQHLIEGILQINDHETEHSLIFRQFGHSLTNPLEPVTDQHVLRAFEIRCLTDYSEQRVVRLRKKGVYKLSDKKLLDSYREWFQLLVNRIEEKDRGVYKEKLDKILFIKGKSLKLDRTTANMGFAQAGADE